MNADRIFVLQAGRLVQKGTYQELLKVPGPFAELASRQRGCQEMRQDRSTESDS
jgi:ABC-type multidrug transport system fused ATPase/permease subunit